MEPVHDVRAFGAFTLAIKGAVELELEALAEKEKARAKKISADVEIVVTALFDLALRGGKRVRPALLAASHVACGGESTSRAVIKAGVALEVLHAYLLVHDDWMDGDDTRRGGPSVHAQLRDRFDSRDGGDACAILAGDFGQAFAFEALAALEAPADRVLAVVAEASRMLGEVVAGQVMDVRGHAASRSEVETMHRLKTSSYTTRTPFVIGAILAGADAQTRDALRDAGDPLGVAFQLRDDLLGTFGDPARTGKSARSDLRRGKRTALVAELEGDRAAAQLLPRVFGVSDAPDDEVDALVRLMASGAKPRVEARLAELLGESRARIAKLALTDEGKELLLGAVEALGAREA